MTETPLRRSQFPVCEQHRYFNHAGVSPLPVVARDAIVEVADDFVANGAVNFPRWETRQEEVRVAAASLMGVPVTDVAFVKNTTEGLGFVANGLTWEAGDRVIVPDLEFPSTIYPWLSLRDLGVQVDIVQPVGPTAALPLGVFADALAANDRRGGTKLVAVSWVQYARGYRTDIAALAQLCHEHGALLCVDVIQGLGVLPLDLTACDVDFAMADAHKWLLGPVGIGVLYVAERHRDLLRPLEPGWASVVHRDDYENLELVYDDSARRFEGGTYNNLTLTGMGASFDLLLATGVDRIWTHVDSLLGRLTSGLEEAGATVLSDRGEGRSAIVTFRFDGIESADLADRLGSLSFATAHRGGGVRIAPHGYNTADEIDALLDAVRSIGRAS